MFKRLYRGLDSMLDKARLGLYVAKTWVWEWVAILSKRSLINSIKHDEKQKQAISNYWQSVYGKKISTRWHRLYQGINGTFNEKYVPDILFSTRIEPKLNPIDYARLYSDKGITELLYSGASGVHFPETILLKSGGHFYDRKRTVIGYDRAIAILMSSRQFVIKPTLGGSSGHGVKVFDDEPFDAVSLFSEYGDNFIIQDKLQAHDAYANIYKSSVNTIRLITYIADGAVFHAPVCLRLGTAGSKVDNIHSGGLVVGVSDDGRLLERAYGLGYCDSKETYLKHPDTDVTFSGYQIPGIGAVIEAGKKLHGRTPNLGIISWDFMIDLEGNVVLVEGNYFGQAIWFPQIVHGKSIFGKNTASVIRSII